MERLCKCCEKNINALHGKRKYCDDCRKYHCDRVLYKCMDGILPIKKEPRIKVRKYNKNERGLCSSGYY